jgi:molybdopterin-binding protein
MRLTSKTVSGFHSSFLIPGLRDLVWVSASSAVATFCLLFRTRLFCTGNSSMPRLYTPRDSAQILGISYPSLKQWIYSGKLKTVQTAGGHHRIPESEINRLLLPVVSPVMPEVRRRMLRRISGRNNLIGRVLDVKISGFVAQVTLSIDGQRVTAIITADAARELRLKKGQIVAAVIKSTQVMVIGLDPFNKRVLAQCGLS